MEVSEENMDISVGDSLTSSDKSTLKHEVLWPNAKAGDLVWISSDIEPYLEARIETVRDKTNLVISRPTRNRNSTETVKVDTMDFVRRGGEALRLLPRIEEERVHRVENLDQLFPLNEAEILRYIELQFRKDCVYTRTGPMLIAMNPFKWLPSLYSDHCINRYHGLDASFDRLAPHIFQEAEGALQALKSGSGDQNFIICGVSGAGKTETTKLIFQFLVQVSKLDSSLIRSETQQTIAGGHAKSMEDLSSMLQMSEVLEAFGNAATIRNHNSSRFGRYMKVYFNSLALISGTMVQNFLLETSRVVMPNKNERNFHIFYQLIKGCDFDMRSELQLPEHEDWTPEKVQSFQYLNTGCVRAADFEDEEDWKETHKALTNAGYTSLQADEIFRVVSAVLSMGNLKLVADGSSNGASKMDQDARDSVLELLGITPDVLAPRVEGQDHQMSGPDFFELVVCNRLRVLDGKLVASPHSEGGAIVSRDSVARVVYSRLFDHLVVNLNDRYKAETTSVNQLRSIGVLDLFGFEKLENNRLEQLLINTANEQMQELFNRSLTTLKALFEREGMVWDSAMDFPSCQDTLDLISKKPMGILPHLDSTCLANGTDHRFVTSLNRQWKDHKRYGVCGPRSNFKLNGASTSDHHFAIRHYAGIVVYDTNGFVSKNVDHLSEYLKALLANSTLPLVAGFFKDDKDLSIVGKQQSLTVAQHFAVSLDHLLHNLGVAGSSPKQKQPNVRFIRCIKSNTESKSDMLDRSYVMDQLVCGGVLAAIDSRRSGLAHQIKCEDFVREYKVFLNKVLGEYLLSKSPSASPEKRAAVSNGAVVPPLNLSGSDEGSHALRRTQMFTPDVSFDDHQPVYFRQEKIDPWSPGYFVKQETGTGFSIFHVKSDPQGDGGDTVYKVSASNICDRTFFRSETLHILRTLSSQQSRFETHVPTITSDDYRLGKSMVFLTARAMSSIVHLKHELLGPIVCQLQAWWIRILQGTPNNALVRLRAQVRGIQSEAVENGVADHFAFTKALQSAQNTLKYALGVVVFGGETFEAARVVAQERIDVLKTLVKSLSSERLRLVEQRAEMLKLLDDCEARLRVVEKGLKEDITLPKFALAREISTVRLELDKHRELQNRAMAKKTPTQGVRQGSMGSAGLRRMSYAHQPMPMLEHEMSGVAPQHDSSFEERFNAADQTESKVDVIEEKFEVLMEEQTKFNLAHKAATANLRNAEHEYAKLSERIDESSLLKSLVVATATKRCKECIEKANITLQGDSIRVFVSECQRASDLVSDLGQLVVSELVRMEADAKIGEARDLVGSSAQLYREIETDADILSLASSSAQYAFVHNKTQSLLDEVNTAEVNDPDAFIVKADKFVAAVRELEGVFRREKALKETADMERLAEMQRLRPAIERLNELQANFEASGIPNYDRVQEAIMKAVAKVDQVRSASSDGSPIQFIRDSVRECLQLILNAEQLFEVEVNRKEQLDREAADASQELLQNEERLEKLAKQIESSGLTVRHLTEESYNEAENSIAEANKLLRKGDAVGAIRSATQLAIDTVRVAEETFERQQTRLVQFDRMRKAEQARLDAAGLLLHKITEMVDEIGLGERSDVLEAIMTAKSAMRLAQTHLSRSMSVAWIENDEIKNDQALTRKAVKAVDDLEDKVMLEKRESEHIQRESRTNAQLLDLTQAKLSALQEMTITDALAGDALIESNLHQAEESVDAARKSQHAASRMHTQSSRKAIDIAAKQVSKLEESIYALKAHKDGDKRERSEAANQIDQVMKELQVVVESIDKATPTVSLMLEEDLDSATKAVNTALRILRHDKDISKFRSYLEHAAEVVAQLDGRAMKVRQQASRAEKLKSTSFQSVKELQAALQAIEHKAIAQGVASFENVATAIDHAQSSLALASRRGQAGIEVWINDPNSMQRVVASASDVIQRAEEIVEDEVHRKERRARLKDKIRMELQQLQSRLHESRTRLSQGDGQAVSTFSAIQQALSETESQVDSASQAFQNGSATMLVMSSASESVQHLEEVIDQQLRAFEHRSKFLQTALTHLPRLQLQLAQITATIEATGPPIATLVGSQLNHVLFSMSAQLMSSPRSHVQATNMVNEVERYTENHRLQMKMTPPDLSSIEDHITGLADQVNRQVKRISGAHSSMAVESKKLDDLSRRFSNTCELVAAFCSRSDHLRISLEAEWQDVCWWQSSSSSLASDTAVGGSSASRIYGYSRKELKPISAVQTITEHVVAADNALSFAKRKLMIPIEAWLNSGASVAHSSIEEAGMKVAHAEVIVQKENAKLEAEEKHRENVMGTLKSLVTQLGTLHAMLEAQPDAFSSMTKHGIKQAERSVEVVGEIVSNGSIIAAKSAMDVASRKVHDAHEFVMSETVRHGREKAEREIAKEQFEKVSSDLAAVEEMHISLGMTDVPFVADAVARAGQAVKECGLMVQTESVGLSMIGRGLQKAVTLIEAAQRAVELHKQRQDELARHALMNEGHSINRQKRASYKKSLQEQARRSERSRMLGELEVEAKKLDSIGGIEHGVKSALQVAAYSISSSRLAIQHAPLAAAQDSLRDAKVRILEVVQASQAHELMTGLNDTDEQLIEQFDEEERKREDFVTENSRNARTFTEGSTDFDNPLSDLMDVKPFHDMMAAGPLELQSDADGYESEGFYSDNALDDELANVNETPRQFMVSAFADVISSEPFVGTLIAKHLSPQTYESLNGIETTMGTQLDDCIASSIEYPDSPYGAFAGDSECFMIFKPFFSSLVRDVHGGLHNRQRESISQQPPLLPTIVEHNPAATVDEEAIADHVVIARAHMHRNLSGFRFPPVMKSDDREEVQGLLTRLLLSLQDDGTLPGGLYSMVDCTNDAELRDVVIKICGSLPHNNDHFKDSAGLYNEWPKSRSVFISDDQLIACFVNCDEHFTVNASSSSSITRAVQRAQHLIDVIGKSLQLESMPYAYDESFGNLTANPLLLGTGLVLEVLVRVPGHVGVAVKESSAPVACPQEYLDCVDIEPTMDGLLCLIKSKRTVGSSVPEITTALYHVIETMVNASIQMS